MTQYEQIIFDRVSGDERIAVITLNRPDKLNALTDQLMLELGDALDKANEDNSIHVVILKGAGRAFSAGYDLSPRDQPLESVQDWREHATKSGKEVILKIWDLRVPVIASVHGYALGGGCDLAIGADITYLAEGTELGEPEVRFVSAPPSLIMPWLIGVKKAKELLLTGDSIGAEEAVDIGLANRVVSEESLEDAVLTLAKRLANIPPISLELNKRAINHAYETMGMKSALDYGAEMFTLLLLTEESAQFAEEVTEKGLKKTLQDRNKKLNK